MYGDDIVFNGQQRFDLVAVATMLHDVLALVSANSFRKTLSESERRRGCAEGGEKKRARWVSERGKEGY